MCTLQACHFGLHGKSGHLREFVSASKIEVVASQLCSSVICSSRILSRLEHFRNFTKIEILAGKCYRYGVSKVSLLFVDVGIAAKEYLNAFNEICSQ